MTRRNKIEAEQIDEAEVVEFTKNILATKNSLNLLIKFPEIFGKLVDLNKNTSTIIDITLSPLPERIPIDLNFQDINVFNALINRAINSLREHDRMPEWLDDFIADVLAGKRKHPTKTGQDINTNLERNFRIGLVAYVVHEKFGLPYYNNNEQSNGKTVADIISKASKSVKDKTIRFVSVDVVKTEIKKMIKQLKTSR
jgi:hypothetical protein